MNDDDRTRARSTGASSSGSGEWSRRPRVGDRLSDYVLERELGEGGMATGDAFSHLAPVGSFPDGRSLFGLEDMIGNVREWAVSPKTDSPMTPLWTYGGSWLHSTNKSTCRAVAGEVPGVRRANNGMRVVADVD